MTREHDKSNDNTSGKTPNVKIYKIVDNVSDEVVPIYVTYGIDQKTIDYIVEKTVEEKVHIDDVVDELNEFPKIRAEKAVVEEHGLTSGGDQE